MSNKQLILLLLLSFLWGLAFLFSGIAVKELHPLYVVLLRVGLAALVLTPFLLYYFPLPNTVNGWLPYIGMGILNNVIPFTFIFFAQTKITVGLSSILNSFTPITTFLVLAAFGSENLTLNKITGSILGVCGVIVLLGLNPLADLSNFIGIILVLIATISYGFAGLWGKRYLAETPPLQSASCQLISSSVVLAIVVGIISPPIPTVNISIQAIISLILLAVLSTALAYIVFFKILTVSGAGNVMLVTLLIPIWGCLLGWMFLDEILSLNQFFGASIIGLSLVIIDGRLLRKIKR